MIYDLDIQVVIGIVEERFLGIKCAEYWPRKT